MNVLSLFAGIGGLDLGLERAGMTVVGQVEIDSFCQRVLAKHWPEVPRHDDVRTTADWWLGEPRPAVDVVCGGFPCQPVSSAGRRRAQADERWLWPAMWGVIRDLRPRYAIMENVPGLLARGMGDVLGDLASIGYDAEWDCVPAAAIGAPHRRDRVFIVAYPDGERLWDEPIAERRGRRPAILVNHRPTWAMGDPVGSASADDQDRGIDAAVPPRGHPELASLMPTPTAALGRGAGAPSADTAAARIAAGRRNLDDAIALLPTPTATEGSGARAIPPTRTHRGLDYGPRLRDVAHLLPTAQAHDAKDTPLGGRHKGGNPTLLGAVLTVPDRWGKYAAAIHRWEGVLGRQAPAPTEATMTGSPRLAPSFAEWLMGFPAGWVAGHHRRTVELRLVGNAVVPQVAEHIGRLVMGAAA